MSAPPTWPPTASELLSHPAIIQALEKAWVDSQFDDPNNRHEEGGWIYMDLTTGIIETQRASGVTRSRLSLGNPPLLPNRVIAGRYQTHPNPASEGWVTGPSSQDELAARLRGVPWLIRAEDGNHHTGPDSRRGGLGAGPGYPP